ncbi:MAG: IPT/TIG domain-containing protein [Elusimicrobiota bacterium]|nr:IPT/TIG domain-containing protein [Elusimicrobiota bacterium]
MRKMLTAIQAVGVLAMWAAASPVSAAPAPGGRIEITIPIRDISGTGSSGLVMSGVDAPAWIDVLPASELGPVSAQAGTGGAFVLALEYLSNIPQSNGAGEIRFTISSAATCRFVTNDYFATGVMHCDDAENQPLSRIRLTDYLAPSTTVDYLVEPHVDASSAIFIQAGSSLALVAVDVDSPTVTRTGVSGSFYRFNQVGGYLPYSSPVSPPGTGEQILQYYSVDVAGNAEAASSLVLKVDGAAPVTSVHRAGFVESLTGRQYFEPGAEIEFIASDEGPDVSAGVSRTLMRVDGGDFVEIASTETLPLPNGFHKIDYLSIDNVENIEPFHRLMAFVGVDVDATPPASSLQFNGPHAIHPSSVSLSVETQIAVVSSDTESGFVTGLASVFVLIDRTVESCEMPLKDVVPDDTAPQGTCENPVYSSTFTLSQGTHTIHFYGIDEAENEEAVHSILLGVDVSSEGGEIPTTAGLDIGRDATGNLWTVIREGEAAALAKGSPSGLFVASAPLPGAITSLPLSVFFDAADRSHVIGNAEGTGSDVAVYRASSAGDEIVAIRTLDSGLANNDYAFAAAAPGWIVGAVQTSGSVDGEGDSTFSLALWRYDPAAESLSLSTTYARGGGLDVGTGVSLDAEGNIWVSGYSEGASTSSRPVDLALWKFSPDGSSLLAGPFTRPRYLADFDGNRTAKLLVSDGVVYVASAREREPGGEDLALVRFASSSGTVLDESAWRHENLLSAVPSAMLPNGTGGVVVAGSVGGASGHAAVWTYESGSAPTSALEASVGAAHGAVYQGTDLWLAVEGSTLPYLAAGLAPMPGGLRDILRPRTSFEAAPSFVSGDMIYVSSLSLLGFVSADDKLVIGDGLGVGGVQISYAVGGASYSAFGSSFSIASEGTHPLSFFGVDAEGNEESVSVKNVSVDLTPPFVVLQTTGSLFALSANDPVSSGVASGIREIHYLVDIDPETCDGIEPDTSAARGTCANLSYAGPFTLSPGTHTVVFRAIDNVGNGEEVIESSNVVVGSPAIVSAITPSTGPIGIPFTIAGPGFGAYAGANTKVLFGGTTAAISVWNDAQIKGTVPGLSTGVYEVTVFRQWPSSVTTRDVGSFEVTRLAPATLSISSGPIGVPFTLTGPGFGPYAGANSRVLIGGVAAPISVWNDMQITGTVPALSTGATTLVVERLVGSFVSSSDPLAFEVTRPFVSAVSPSSAPIGAPFTLSGASFGPYAGTNTRVLFGGTTAAISVWNDSTIKGTVPGISTGVVTLVVERAVGAFTSASETRTFDVTRPAVAAVTPSSGPIGAVFTLSGASFGPYAGANTRVLIGGTTTPISVWNDSTIKGTVPGALSPGLKDLVVERVASNGARIQSEAVSFQVAGLAPNPITPSSGPIGIPFTITGMDFGAYAGANTRVLFGATTASISVWNDTTISGRVPALSTGDYAVIVERQQGAGISSAFVSTFTLTELVAADLSPSSAPAGAPFTISGSGFGPYAGADSRVLIGGATAPISVWNDSQIKGSVPGVPAGVHELVIERAVGGSVQASAPAAFEVLTPFIASVDPSSGPIGIAFSLAGAGFGPYAGANTRVLIGGATTPISVWNDAQIKGTVPGALAVGLHILQVQRQTADGWLSDSNTVYFQVTQMAVAEVSPSSGPIGITFTLSGGPFGAYAGANTRVLIGGATAAISVWNDSTIKGTVPALPTGTHELVVEREQGGFIASSTGSFTVADIVIADLSPSSGPIGAPITLTGGSFGAYAGANTRLLIGGSTAAVSVWNDATIKATVPSLPEGLHPIWVERKSGSGVQSSATSYFQVLTPAVATLTPSSAPIGAPFTLTGTGFGPYAGSNTRVLLGGVAAPISVWNDSTIKGTVPGALGPGPVELLVERVSGGGLSRSATQAFEVLVPVISTLTPASGPTGTVITLNGSGFGPYGGSATRLLVGASTATVSVWNDRTIRGTVPGDLADGEYPVVIERAPAGGTVRSASATFTVESAVAPSALSFSAPLSAQPDQNFEGGLALAAADGGRVETPSKAAVEVPPAAMEDDTEITLRRADDDAHRAEATKAAQVRSAGEPIEFGPEGTRFTVPVVIELPYDPTALGVGMDQTKIAVHYYDPLKKAWEQLLSEVDVARKVVRARTDHFSLYQPMLPGIGTAAAQDEFSLRTAYVFPNPSRNSQAVTFRIQPGLADSVTVRVYDISGRKVHESSIFTGPTLLDDGNGLGAQQTYDHVWSVSGVGSGVYIYAITAKKAGQRDIVTKGKVGVIK